MEEAKQTLRSSEPKGYGKRRVFSFTTFPDNSTMLSIMFLAACSFLSDNINKPVSLPSHKPAALLGDDGSFYANAIVDGITVKLPAPLDLRMGCAERPVFIGTTQNGVTTGNWKYDCNGRTDFVYLQLDRSSVELAPFIWIEKVDDENFTYLLKFTIIEGQALPVTK